MLRSLFMIVLAGFLPSFLLSQDGTSEMKADSAEAQDSSKKYYSNGVMLDMIRPLPYAYDIALSYDKKIPDHPFGVRANFSWSAPAPSFDFFDIKIGTFVINSLEYLNAYHLTRNTFKWSSSLQINYYFVDEPAVEFYLSLLGGIGEYEAWWVIGRGCYRTAANHCYWGPIKKYKWTYIGMIGLGPGVDLSLGGPWFLNADLQIGYNKPLRSKGKYLNGPTNGVGWYNSLDIVYKF